MIEWPELRRALDAIAFARIVVEESKRTLFVLPADLDRARWTVEQCGAERFFTVETNPWLPANTWYLLDVQALEADQAEALQHMAAAPFASRDVETTESLMDRYRRMILAEEIRREYDRRAAALTPREVFRGITGC